MKFNSLKTWYFIFYIFLILYLSSRTISGSSWLSDILIYDKVIHYLEYLILGFLLINALKNNIISRKKWFYAILFLITFPIIDESFQYFIPKRVPSILDGVADIFGGISGAIIRRYLY